MKYFLPYLLLILCLNLSANEKYKEGYVIKLNGDSVHGLVLYQNSLNACKSCIFKEKSEDSPVNYSPEQISGYRYKDSKYYVSKIIPGNSTSKPAKVFMEYLLNGTLDLYYYTDYNGVHYFIENNSLELTELPGKVETTEGSHIATPKYIGLLRSSMDDCVDIFPEIDKTVLSAKPLIYLMKDYHERVCTTEDCIIYENQNLSSKFSFGVIAGLSMNQYNFGGDLLSSFEKCFQIGIGMKIKRAFFSNERFGINMNLLLEKDSKYIMKAKYNGGQNYEIIYQGTTYKLNTEDVFGTIPSLPVKLNVIDLKLPVIVNYYAPIKRSNLIMGIGLTDKIIISQNKEYQDRLFYKQYGKSLNSLLVGAIANAGFEKRINKDHTIGLTIQYEYLMAPRALNQFLRLTEQQLSFQLSYFFL